MKHIDFEVVGKYHYPFTDSSLAFITCDREAACSTACKDTVPAESREGARHARRPRQALLTLCWWHLLTPLWECGALPSWVFLLLGAPRWLEVHCMGLGMVIQPWLSLFSLLRVNVCSQLLSNWKDEILALAMFSLSKIPLIFNRNNEFIINIPYLVSHYYSSAQL